jgi:hypothetical protein
VPTATALDLITAALVELNVVAAGEVVPSGDALLGLASLNRMLDSWKTEHLLVSSITRTTFTITPSTATYTVGTGGTVNVSRPVYIDHVTFLDTSGTTPLEIPLVSLTDDAWTAVALKDMESPWPTAYYYQGTFPLGTLTFWPVPTSTTITGVLYGGVGAPEMATLVTAFSLPPGYQMAICKNLAVDLSVSYKIDPQTIQLLIKQAADSKATVKRSNTRLRDMGVDLGALVQGHSGMYGYNIQSDGYN